MEQRYNVLVINPGSTSTKIAIFNGFDVVFEQTLRHSSEELKGFHKIIDQYDFRKNVILNSIKENGYNLENLDAVVGRGGLLKPIPSGTYLVNDDMLQDMKTAKYGEHASNLGGTIAYEIASSIGKNAYIVDPVVVDEMDDIARISGYPELPRKCIFHALNQKAVARRTARDLGKNYDKLNLVIAHLGGGISVAAHRKGKIIDVNNALDGDGPFSPERTGGLPFGDLIKLCYSGKYTADQLKKQFVGKGGMVAYLNTNDGRQVRKMIDEGDKKAELVYKAMAYQVSKEIGAQATVLKGQVDCIAITGGLAYDDLLVSWIKESVGFIAPINVYPGEDEMLALCEGVVRVLDGSEQAAQYKS
jgi:butyrate kinase